MNKFKYVIFTDLDGTLLDKTTFKPGRALKTLEYCNQVNIPVVFVSAKTRAEIEPLRVELNNTSPFIVENGGGLYLPARQFKRPNDAIDGGDYWTYQARESIEELRRAIKNIAVQLKLDIRTFGEMSPAEIASITGLDTSGAKLAQMREFDEPFMIVDETPEKLQAVIGLIEKSGYRYTEGGILHHITGNFDKGETIEVLKNVYLELNPAIEFIGLGDAYNDISMLKTVDHPFLVRKPDGSHEDIKNCTGLKISQGIGPDGFAESVESMLLE